MGIDFDREHALGIIFRFRVLVDFAAQLIGLAAIHAPGWAAPASFDLAQPLKEQHAAWVGGAHRGDDACDFVGSVFVHAPYMPPEVLIAVLPFDRFACKILLFTDLFEMQIARPIQPMIAHKDGFDDLAVLSECDDGEIAHIQVDTDRHEIRISFALDDLLRFAGFRLRKMQFGTLRVENQLGACFFPGGLLYPLLEVARGLDRVVVPLPARPGVDFELCKTVLRLAGFQIQAEGALIERGMIGGAG
jgi:hypothetical protein